MAIRAAAWSQVAELQSQKTTLQDHFLTATRKFREEASAANPGWKEGETEFRGMLDELINLEKRNNDWLQEQRRNAEVRGGELNRSSLNLRQIHRAYGQPATVAWHSYS